MHLHKVLVFGKNSETRTKESPSSPQQLWALLSGACILKSDAFTPLDEFDDHYDLENPNGCYVKIPRPDEVVEKTSAFEGLSQESQFVLGLVLDTPIEAMAYICTPIHDKVSKSRLFQYLRNVLKWNEGKMQRVLDELSRYVNDF